jgi:hypothetical protein
MPKVLIPIAVIIALLLIFQPEPAVITDRSEPSAAVIQNTPVIEAETLPTGTLEELQEPELVEEDDEQSDTLDPDAIESLRQARLHGDERTPNLNKSRERDELPTPEQMEDPELYQEYERRQQQRVYRAYVEAAKIKTAEIRKMIEQGKEGGISDEEIAFAEAKIQGIEDMAAQLQQEHPDIMQDEYKPADDWLIDNLGVSDPQTDEENVPDDN